MIDSITSMHTTMQQAQLMQQVQTSVLARTIETAEVQGEAMVDLIAASNLAGQSQVLTDPMLGQNVDTFA
ncbi:MAG: putative motility protein [Spirochaetaceae bacterium]|nr:MAG: putative motility protein [Spirochaetaceae bacterium]